MIFCQYSAVFTDDAARYCFSIMGPVATVLDRIKGGCLRILRTFKPGKRTGFYRDLETVKRRVEYALDTAQVGIFEWDFITNRAIWTEAENEFYGFPKGTEEVDAALVLKQLDKEGLRELFESIEKAKTRPNADFMSTFKITSLDGARRWLMGKGRLLESKPGEFTHAIGINIDVTELKETEEKLQAALYFSEKVVDTFPAHIYVLNVQETKFRFVNRTMADFHGVTAFELCGWDEAKIEHKFHPDDVVKMREGRKMMGLLKEGESSVSEFRLFDKNGGLHWMQAQNLPFSRDPETGEVLEIIGAAVDISHQKVIQEELHLAKEQAEHANRLKSAFLANVSHEIRTPLGVVIGYSGLIRDQTLSLDEREKYLDIIAKNGDQLSRLINDILDLSKVESGELRIEIIGFNLRSTLQEILEPLILKANQNGLNFSLSVDESVPDIVVSDPMRFCQIIQNIAGNAVKFTSKGQVAVSAYQKETNNDKILFVEVSDSGIGISEDCIPKLFKPFSQIDFSMTRRYGGTGLGLALSKRLAQVLGGDIILKESRPMKGSTFLVTVRNQTLSEEAPLSVVMEPMTNRLKGINVLVVDDCEENLMLVKVMLSQAGAKVEFASNGQEAIDKILGNGYDLVLMDVQMPIMDGYTATAKLRQEGFKKPIIALTAHALSDMRAKSLTVGCNDHISKPINPKELIDKIVSYTRAI